MSPEQFDIFLERNDQATDKAVGKYVNGKVDAMTQKLDDHIKKHDAAWEEIKPAIEVIKGTKILGNFIKWSSSVGIAMVALWALLKGLKL